MLSPKDGDDNNNNNEKINRRVFLETFSVDDGWTHLIKFLLSDPHAAEGRERCQNGTADPDGVLSLWRRHDLDLGRCRGQFCHLFADTFSNT